MSKSVQIRDLARKRREAKWPDYTQVEDYHNGKHACDFVSPYSKSAHNFDADLFLMLQDWTSAKSLSGPEKPEQIRLGYTPGKPTNKFLIRLLREVFDFELADTFTTNLFPFIKSGGKRAKIRPSDLVRAAKEYGLPQVEIIQPKVVLCFGLPTFQSLQIAVGLPKARSMEQAMECPFERAGATFYYLAHPGFGPRNRGGYEQYKQDWENIREQAGPLVGRS